MESLLQPPNLVTNIYYKLPRTTSCWRDNGDINFTMICDVRELVPRLTIVWIA